MFIRYRRDPSFRHYVSGEPWTGRDRIAVDGTERESELESLRLRSGQALVHAKAALVQAEFITTEDTEAHRGLNA